MRRIKIINGILHDAQTGLQIWCWSRSTVCQDMCAGCQRKEFDNGGTVRCRPGDFTIGILEPEGEPPR